MQIMVHKTFILLFILFFSLTIKGQFFQACLEHDGNQLIVEIKPTDNMVTGFSSMEFFIRHQDDVPPFTIGNIIHNLDSFPDIGTLAYIGENTQGGNEPGFVNHQFSFNIGASAPIERLYLPGISYEVFRVELVNGPPGSTGNFQIVSNTFYYPTYLSINFAGNDLTNPDDPFYGPDLGNDDGAFGGTTFYEGQSSVALPVELLDFTVEKEYPNSALLKWSTMAEIGLSRFEVERSIDALHWKQIAEIQSKGSPGGMNLYQYRDIEVYDPVMGSVDFYYRLRCIDLDGSYDHSPTRSIHFESKDHEIKGLTIYPNPASTEIHIEMTEIKPSKHLLSFYDIKGNLILQRNPQNQPDSHSKWTINIVGLGPGTYMVNLTDQLGYNEWAKLVVQKQ